MVNMYYQMLRGKTMPHLYIPRRENRAVVIPVKQQPPADAGRRQFCVEIDVGWACLHDMVIGKDEEKRAPKYPLRSSWRISEIQSILFRIFVPTEENSDINIDFVPFLWYKDNNGCDVTILSTLWFNNQEGVDNIVLAPLGQEGVVFVDMAYTVTKRGLKLTLVMEMEVQREKAVKDIMNSFLKMPMLQDNQMQNDDHNELDSSGSPSETATFNLSKKCANLLADIEKCSDDNSQIVTQQLDELSNSCGEDAAGQHCQAPGDNKETPADAKVGGEEQMPADLTPAKCHPELSKEVQCIMQILREQQQMRDDVERESAELKQKLEVLHHEAAMLSLQQRQALETIAKDEHDSEFSEETREETSGRTVVYSAHTPPIQDSDAHNYKDQQMLEFENHLQRRAYRTALQVGVHCPHPVEASGVWKGKPPSPAESETPFVTTLIHYKQTQSTFNIHLGHCHTCNKTIEVLFHGATCREDGCASCLQITREVAQHIARCTRDTRCLLHICAADVSLGLYDEYGTADVTPTFVGLVRLYLRCTFSRG